MALFRVQSLPLLSPLLSRAPGAYLSLASAETLVLKGGGQRLYRAFSVRSNRNGLLLQPYTRPTARFSTRTGEKRPQDVRKEREHGSVLNELMSVKESPQPTQLTVGAKGMASQDFLGIFLFFSWCVIKLFRLERTSHTYWWCWVGLLWLDSYCGLSAASFSLQTLLRLCTVRLSRE